MSFQPCTLQSTMPANRLKSHIIASFERSKIMRFYLCPRTGSRGYLSRRNALMQKPMHALIVLLLSALLATLSTNAFAKDLYVDGATGNDNISYADNSQNNPWRTVGRAVWGSSSINSPNGQQAAQPGDVVIVRAGVYNTSAATGQRYLPIYNPINSGTANNPIIIRAEGNVVLESSTSGDGEPIIGAYGKSHIIWDGFVLHEANINTKADTGPVVVWQSSYITIQNLTIHGITSSWNDNHNSIRLERASNSVIRNNTISGNRNAGQNRNGAAIMLYYCNDIVIEHNEISDSNGAIFIKGANDGPIIVRYNIMRNNTEGIALGGIGTAQAQRGAQIYQNIIRDNLAGITFIGYDAYSPAHVSIVNNTLFNNTYGGLFFKPSTAGYRNLIFINNIFSGNQPSIQAEDISDLSSMTYTHNIYHASSTHARVDYRNYSFSSWQTTFAKDTTGSSLSDPLFTNPGNNDFTLANNSPALNAGVDVLNLQGQGTSAPITLGAYITGTETIGVSDQQQEPPATPSAPQPPSGFSGAVVQ